MQTIISKSSEDAQDLERRLAKFRQSERDLESQRRRSKWSAAVLTLVVHALVIAILAAWIIPALQVDPPQIHAKTLPPSENPAIITEVTQATVRSKPSAPSSSSRLITSSSTTASFVVPTTRVDTTTGDIGTGAGIGLGFGSGGFGSGMGGEVSFFGQSSRAQRILFIIDASQSMRVSGSTALMKKELAKTLELLKPGLEYGILFFSGPVWQIGDEISDAGKEVTLQREIKSPGGAKVAWSAEGNNQFSWKIKSGKMPSVRWLKASPSQIQETLAQIKKVPSIAGTDLRYPFEVAFGASPKADVIYFMTDAQAHAQANERVKAIVGEATRGLKKTPVNCIVMMENQALAHMKVLAKETGGMLSFVEKSGKLKHLIKGEAKSAGEK